MSGSDNGDDRLGWFENLYRNAGGDTDNVPWQRPGPHPGLAHWAQSSAVHAGTAIDVGCGLGENAEFLARLGYRVTAFDLSQSAVDWAKRRFPDTAVSYHVADLFDLPDAWRGAFDLVDEIYTLQALPADLRPSAIRQTSALAAPGGRVLIVCMGRDEDEHPGGNPPYPLARSELAGFKEAGLVETAFEDLVLSDNGRRHFIAVYERPKRP